MQLIPELECKYPEGSDLTIMNTFYSYPVYGEGGRKEFDDMMILVYKNNETKEKEYKIIYKL